MQQNNDFENPLARFSPPVKPLTHHQFAEKFALFVPYITLIGLIWKLYSNHRFTSMLKKVEKKL